MQEPFHDNGPCERDMKVSEMAYLVSVKHKLSTVFLFSILLYFIRLGFYVKKINVGSLPISFL